MPKRKSQDKNCGKKFQEKNYKSNFFCRKEIDGTFTKVIMGRNSGKKNLEKNSGKKKFHE